LATPDRIIGFIRQRAQPAWLVGGYVRDQLLGRSSHDLDVIVPEGGIRLARAIAAAFDGAFFVLDSERDVGRAILRDEAGEALEVDVARLRLPDLAADLALRDFTVNAIALDIVADAAEPVLVDPFAGRADLDRRLVRAVSDAAFVDDPLRMLRAVRQAIELGFSIEESTFDLIRRDAALLPQAAGERIRDELLRIISVPGAWLHVRLLAHLNLLEQVLPEAQTLIGVQQSVPHYQDVFEHTRSVMAHLEGIYALLWPHSGYTRLAAVAGDATVLLDAGGWAWVSEVLSPYAGDLAGHLAQPLASSRLRREWLLWAALMHDWGKPAKRSEDADGRSRFLEHDRWGALLAEHRGQELKLSADEVSYLARLVDQHMRPGYLARDFPPSRRAIYRFYCDVGTLGPDCALLGLADHLAIHAPRIEPEHTRRRLETTRILLEAFFRERATRVDPPLFLNGRAVMAAFNLQPGPEVGRRLEQLREAQAVGEVSSAEEALAWLAGRVESGV